MSTAIPDSRLHLQWANTCTLGSRVSYVSCFLSSFLDFVLLSVPCCLHPISWSQFFAHHAPQAACSPYVWVSRSMVVALSLLFVMRRRWFGLRFRQQRVATGTPQIPRLSLMCMPEMLSHTLTSYRITRITSSCKRLCQKLTFMVPGCVPCTSTVSSQRWCGIWQILPARHSRLIGPLQLQIFWCRPAMWTRVQKVEAGFSIFHCCIKWALPCKCVFVFKVEAQSWVSLSKLPLASAAPFGCVPVVICNGLLTQGGRMKVCRGQCFTISQIHM